MLLSDVDDAIKSGVPVVFVDTKGINEGNIYWQ